MRRRIHRPLTRPGFAHGRGWVSPLQGGRGGRWILKRDTFGEFTGCWRQWAMQKDDGTVITQASQVPYVHTGDRRASNLLGAVQAQSWPWAQWQWQTPGTVGDRIPLPQHPPPSMNGALCTYLIPKTREEIWWHQSCCSPFTNPPPKRTVGPEGGWGGVGGGFGIKFQALLSIHKCGWSPR